MCLPINLPSYCSFRLLHHNIILSGLPSLHVVTSLFSFLFVIEHMMPLCMVISWVYSVAMMIQHIVAEKEQRLKEVSACRCRVVACPGLRSAALAARTTSMSVSKL